MNEKSSNVSEKSVVKNSLQVEANKAESANNDTDENPRQSLSAWKTSEVFELMSKFRLLTF